MQIKDQVTLVVGAASGIGAETARHFSSLDAKLILFDKNGKDCKALAKELKATSYEVDITVEAQIKNALDELTQSYGAPRILINCAGIAPARRIVGNKGVMPQAEFEQVIDTNLLGCFDVMRQIAGLMSKLDPLDEYQQRGVIINTASIAAFDGQAGQAAYAASKSAIAGLTLPAARDLAKYGIRVMAIAPGVMNTPMLAAMPEDVRKKLEIVVPFPKRLGVPREFATLAQHIVENDYLNGEVIRLDGALRMPHEV
ncbi:MAG: fabG 8 [Gammaproteobacteria bacterium]|jgi:NAD(P)-dependent dehydrogenase (short-subunit alcohol dehydrogenase family)|nr:fabG 8 [Gammaproteobacteria bacterium]